MKKMLILTAVLLGSSVALAQSFDANAFNPKILGSSPFLLGATVAIGTAFVKERVPALKGWGVVATSFGLGLASSAALHYSGNGATIAGLSDVLGWVAFGGLSGLVASGGKDLVSSLLSLWGSKKAAVVLVPSSSTPGVVVPVGGVQDAPQ